MNLEKKCIIIEILIILMLLSSTTLATPPSPPKEFSCCMEAHKGSPIKVQYVHNGTIGGGFSALGNNSGEITTINLTINSGEDYSKCCDYVSNREECLRCLDNEFNKVYQDDSKQNSNYNTYIGILIVALIGYGVAKIYLKVKK